MMGYKINGDNVELIFTTPRSVLIATANHDEMSEASLFEVHKNAIASVFAKSKQKYEPLNMISECVHIHTLTDEEELHSHILVKLNSKSYDLESTVHY